MLQFIPSNKGYEQIWNPPTNFEFSNGFGEQVRPMPPHHSNIDAANELMFGVPEPESEVMKGARYWMKGNCTTCESTWDCMQAFQHIDRNVVCGTHPDINRRYHF